MKRKNDFSDGFSLIELTIALAIATLMFTGIYMVSLQTMNFLQMARDESRATQAATYEMEKLRSRTWMSLLTMDDDTAFDVNDNAALGYLRNGVGSIKRTAITPAGLFVDILGVTVTVNWTAYDGTTGAKTLTSAITKRGMLK